MPFSREANTHTSPSMAPGKAEVGTLLDKREGTWGVPKVLSGLSVPRHSAFTKFQGTKTTKKVKLRFCCLEENAVCKKSPQERLRRK